MNTDVVGPGDPEALEIDQFLTILPCTLLYSSNSYLRLLESFLECDIRIVILREDSKILGIFPLAFKNFVGMTICNSLPYFGSNGGMVVNHNQKDERNRFRSVLYEKAYEIALERNCAACTIISNPLDQETDEWLKTHARYEYTDKRIGQVTQLPGADNDDALIRSFDDPRPRNIRKAIKEGVTVRYSHSSVDMEFLYDSHFRNITAIGGIPKDRSFFDSVSVYFARDQYRIYVAEYGGERIAALLLFYFNQTVEYFTPATVEKYRNQQPAALMIYTAMKDAIAMDYKKWNWGGTWLSQGGVYSYKKKWGTEDLPYNYYTTLFNKVLLSKTAKELASSFPNFYILPYNTLIENQS